MAQLVNYFHLKAVMVRQHSQLECFLALQSSFAMNLPGLFNFTPDCLTRFREFINQSKAFIRKSLLLLPKSIVEILQKQQQWLGLCEQLKALQLASTNMSPMIVLPVDLNVYTEFTRQRKQEAELAQKQRLLLQFADKKDQTSPPKKIVLRTRGALPSVPDFESTISTGIELTPVNQIKAKESNSSDFEDFSDSASTGDASIIELPLSQTSSTKTSTDTSTSTSAFIKLQGSSPLEKPVKENQKLTTKLLQIEEFLLEITKNLKISSKIESSLIFRQAILIAKAILPSSAYFRGKTFATVASAILMLAGKTCGHPIAVSAIVKHAKVQEKERTLLKALRSLEIALNSSASQPSVEPESIIKNLVRSELFACVTAAPHIEVASEYLYRNMCINGFVVGTQIDSLCSAIVFVAAQYNGLNLGLSEFEKLVDSRSNLHNDSQQIVGSLSGIVQTILDNRHTLINNHVLFATPSINLSSF